MKKLVIILSLLCMSCASTLASKINRLSVGMTKPEVIQILGNPDTVMAQDNIEVLEYRLFPTKSHAFYGVSEPYWVYIINNKVAKYGHYSAVAYYNPPQPQSVVQIQTNVLNEQKKEQ